MRSSLLASLVVNSCTYRRRADALSAAGDETLVLHSTAFNLGLVDARLSDMPALASALLPDATDDRQHSNRQSLRRLTALLLNPPDVATARHLAEAVRCATRQQQLSLHFNYPA